MTRIIHIPRIGTYKEGLDSLPDTWQDEILTAYSLGSSDAEIKAMIYFWRGRFSDSLWYRWLKEEEIFRETVSMGRILSEAWFNRLGRENMNKQGFNVISYIFQMKNRGFAVDSPVNEKRKLEDAEEAQIDYTKLSTETLKELISAKKHESKG